MPKLVDLTGKIVGNLKVVKRHPENGASGKPIWVCDCRCGKTGVLVLSVNLQSGKSQSCGCGKAEANIARSTHGMSQSPEYRTWIEIRKRCYNEKHEHYARYGGRGITVCDEWQEFENFFHDMGRRPSPAHTIDRIKNELGYSKENCRWATRVEQANNRSSNRFYEHGGQSKTLAEWSRELGLNPNTVWRRIHRQGWTIDEALQPIEAKLIDYDGTTKTLQNWCDLLGLDPCETYLRILRGTAFEDIATE